VDTLEIRCHHPRTPSLRDQCGGEAVDAFRGGRTGQGLIKAVDGFDPGRGKPFFGYLVPTIVGELKRHFRGKGWDVPTDEPGEPGMTKYVMSARDATALLDLLDDHGVAACAGG
jgi:sigma-70-like protein